MKSKKYARYDNIVISLDILKDFAIASSGSINVISKKKQNERNRNRSNLNESSTLFTSFLTLLGKP